MPNQNILSIQACITINKNITPVFSFYANPSNDKLWRTEINESILNGNLQKGVEVTEYSMLSKKASNNLMELVCTEYQENKLVIFETKPNAPFYLKSERRVILANPSRQRVKVQCLMKKLISRFLRANGIIAVILDIYRTR